jgi:transposase
MARPNGLRIELSSEQQTFLAQFIKTGKHRSREIIRATVLLKLHAGIAPRLVADQVGASYQTVNQVSKKFTVGGLDRALFDAVRSGAPAKVTAYYEADLTLLACSKPPEGAERWTICLLSDEMVSLGYEEGGSKSTVRRTLKKVNSNRGRKPAGASVT